MKSHCRSRPISRTGTNRQRGAALVIALVFLIALTLLGLASMGGNVLQQRMTYSVGESNRAFQGAETGIINGEIWLDTQALQPVPDCPETDAATCWDSTSIWPGRPPPPGTPEVTVANLQTPGWWLTRGRPVGWRYMDGQTVEQIDGQGYAVAGVEPNVADAAYPRYVVEELGKDPAGSLVIGGAKVPVLWYYQISARGGGATSGASPTITQSVYTRNY